MHYWTGPSPLARAAKAWGDAEGTLQRTFFAYCMDRFQRNPRARSACDLLVGLG